MRADRIREQESRQTKQSGIVEKTVNENDDGGWSTVVLLLMVSVFGYGSAGLAFFCRSLFGSGLEC